MMHGIINIYKPENMTSHDVVARLRRILGMKKIGHTGTLDPMATGVLPVCLGSATRITEYLDMDFKIYRCTMRLGLITDTQDIWGKTVEIRPTEGVTEEKIREAFLPFHGEIDQKPPMYSAVRVDGRRLYEYARAGEQVEVKSRKIYIRDLTIEAIDLAAMEVTFTVECSKGTYIRTICQDVGMALGTGAAMTSLIRLASGRFTLDHAWTLEEVAERAAEDREQAAAQVAWDAETVAAQAARDAENADNETAEDRDVVAAQAAVGPGAGRPWAPSGAQGSRIAQILLPPDYPLTHFGRVVLPPELGKKFVDGWHISLRDCRIERKPEFSEREPEIPIRDEYRRAWCLYQEDRQGESREGGPIFLGVAFYDLKYKKLVADKVFFRGQDET